MDQLPKHICTTNGKLRCRFDMMIRWPDNAGRLINPLTVRGDKFGDTEHDKMLHMLLRYLIRDHERWLMAQLHDNTIPMNDAARIIVKYYKGNIVKNRLRNYSIMLQDFILPEYLKQQINDHT